MTSVLFVHGTGVRESVFNRSFEVISEEILKRRPSLKMVPCFWGGPHGATLQQGGASLPGSGTRGLDLDAEPMEETEHTRWAMLYQDPLYELRLLGVGADHPPNQTLASRLAHLYPSPELQRRLVAAGLDAYWPRAQEYVLTAEAFQAALRVSHPQQETLAAVVARALVAEALARQAAAEPGTLPLDADLRDELVLFFTVELAGEARFLDDLKKDALDLVYRAATSYVGGRREDLTQQNLPGVGDALHYLARGATIRRFVQRCIAEAEPPVVVLAHSLGGLISVDLLIEQALPQVALLVTVGTQVPFFYEINALVSLPYGEALPPHFPRWLNVYDPNDFLSYVAEALFPERATDILVDTRQPYPPAHSAYWRRDETWQALLPHFPR